MTEEKAKRANKIRDLRLSPEQKVAGSSPARRTISKFCKELHCPSISNARAELLLPRQKVARLRVPFQLRTPAVVEARVSFCCGSTSGLDDRSPLRHWFCESYRMISVWI